VAVGSLQVSAWGWAAVAAALVVLLAADLVASSRRNRPVRMQEAAAWTLATVVLAVGFGALLALTSGSAPAGQFFAGWLTEYSLSLDNLLVFVVLIAWFHVPASRQGRVVLAGIGIAVVLRGVVIGVGAAALNRFGWLEYLLGLFLLYTAAQVARRPAETLVAPGPGAGASVTQDEPAGVAGRVATRLTRRGTTGMLAVVIALGVTDVVFAFDSIPAVFGLTHDAFLVFSANVFALLGLRHLYFLVAGLLARLAYLQAGLCVILAFIGLKLFGEALRGSGVTKIGPVPVPVVGPWLSLAVIVVVLAASVLASTMVTRRHAGQRERAAQAVCGERR